MKMKFINALFGLLLMAPVASSAQTANETSDEVLVLKMADNTTANFWLGYKPTVDFADDKLVITSNDATTTYNQADVAEFYFASAAETAVDGKQAAQFSFAYNDNTHVVIAGTKAKKATIYTLDGQLVKSQKISGGNTTVSLADCQPGVYVLNLENEHSFKLIKK